MNKKIFVFDIDGTLIDPKTHKIPESAFQALDILRQQGHIVGLATGRNILQVEKVLDLKDFAFAILCNGGYVELNGKKIFDDQFSQEEKNKVISEMNKHGLEYGVMTSENIYSENPESSKIKKVIDFFDIKPPLKASNLHKMEVFQFNIYEDPNTIPLLSLSKEDYVIHSYGYFGYDIVLNRVTKGSALKKLFNYLNYDLKDCYAFGDADNDITFLETAGVGVAMGNASEEAKKAADYITNDVDDNGIYNALKVFGYIK